MAASLTGVYHPDDPECYFIGISSPQSGWNTPLGMSLEVKDLEAKMDFLKRKEGFTYSILVSTEPKVEKYELAEASNLDEEDRMAYLKSHNTLLISKSLFSAVTESPLRVRKPLHIEGEASGGHSA